MKKLEQEVRSIIEKIYKCKYDRGLSISKNGDLYILKLFLHDPNFGALVIANDSPSDQDFIDYVTKELKNRKLNRSQHFKLIIYGNHES